MTPTARSLELLREMGYLPAVVEHWNPHARIRQDLYGWADILAIGHGVTLAIQACVDGDIQKRARKSQATKGLEACITAGWKCQVWGWGLRGARGARKLWTLRRIDLATGQEIKA